MQVINLIDKKILQDKNIIVGKWLGQGAHGEVFDITDTPDRVIKLSVLYDTNDYHHANIEIQFSTIENTLSKLILNSPSHFVKMFNFYKFNVGQRKVVYGQQKYITYGYTMEKLFPLSDNEKKTLKTVCDIYNKKVEDNRPLEIILKELSQWYEIDVPKVLTFYSYVLSSPVRHLDFHRRNILKDLNGNFKLIDLDLVKLGD